MKTRRLNDLTGRAAVIAALLLSACARPLEENTGEVVAEAYEEKLHRSDLRRMIPVGTAPEDSVALAKAYMESWARERVLLRKAEENLTERQKDVEDRLRSYRISLITYAYEQAIVQQNLDTNISQAEIETYYKDNSKNFELKDNIVRARWFKMRENDDRVLRRTQELWRSADPEDRSRLEHLLAQRGILMNDTREEWIPFSELQQQVALHPDNPTDWLQRNNRAMVKDSVGTAFVEILEHRLKDSNSPLPLVAPGIRSILLNQRKLTLIDRMRNDLFNDAITRQDVKIH